MKTDQTPGIPKSFMGVGDKNKWVTSLDTFNYKNFKNFLTLILLES